MGGRKTEVHLETERERERGGWSIFSLESQLVRSAVGQRKEKSDRSKLRMAADVEKIRPVTSGFS
jgi:hypothetical protein